MWLHYTLQFHELQNILQMLICINHKGFSTKRRCLLPKLVLTEGVNEIYAVAFVCVYYKSEVLPYPTIGELLTPHITNLPTGII